VPERGRAGAAETLRTWRQGAEPITAYNDEVAVALLAGLRILGRHT
jgi:hypothetical protein